MQLDFETNNKKEGKSITLPIRNAGESADMKVIALKVVPPNQGLKLIRVYDILIIN
jgi:hypothetical protein